MNTDIYLQSPAGETTIIPVGASLMGRESASLVVINDPASSRQHAQLTREADQVWITDLNSANGTFVNDNRLQANQLYPLNSGDRVSIGGRINYTIHGAVASANAAGLAGTVLLSDMPAAAGPAYPQYPLASPPPPYPAYNAGSQPGVKPGKVQAIAIMNLIDGVLNVMWGIGLTCSAVASLIGILLIPFTVYPIILGIMELVYASQLLSTPPGVRKPAQYLAIMQLLNIVLFEPISLIIGIISLVFYSDEEVKRYFESLSGYSQ